MAFMDKIRTILEPKGFEAYPFKIGWYNEHTLKTFNLPYEYDTLAYIIISTPDMFEKTFKPFLCEQDSTGGRDLIDECMIHVMQSMKNDLDLSDPSAEVEILHDFELHHTRRPKILVQTAGHVAGAAYYYQRSDVISDPWGSEKNIYGVSLHPKYGGWFALRAVIIFKNVKCSELERQEPPDCLKTDELKCDLLEKFNFNWRDWSYRDVIPVIKKYSEEQKIYFETMPGHRKELISQIKENGRITINSLK